MPGANEVFGCPRKYFLLVVHQHFSNSFPKIYDDLFLVIYQNFSLFRISCQISRVFAPWMPPVLHHTQVTTFFSSCFVIYLHFSRKLAPWLPPGWMPGPVAPSAPSSARHWIILGTLQLVTIFKLII